ncbi:leukemia NUP98 fusion partner 1 isoform X1 [Etheostoma spectabile]|uniref:leukemia NUP98 fusion partner 1 isoform X1 n=1 Tax=Etheostoma spectabile TaxID=54343 RepID=UPI0013AF6418|nr:leukemia NUP98 fusion partner 1 isoform X1 [Etheostoma spectabile]
MSLRLLPSLMVDDDDDDGNFTKWMSSYWGHGAECGHSRERKHSFRRSAKAHGDRRASLPTVSQLDAMKLNRFHAATMTASPSHVKTREDKGEVRPHQRARWSFSEDNSRSKSAVPENRITTIPELTESFQKRLFLRDKRTMSVNGDDKLCLICCDDMQKGGGGVQELHCAHRFHKEAAHRLEQCRPRSGSEAAACEERRLSDERRYSADGPISMVKEPHTPRRQLSLRRHR